MLVYYMGKSVFVVIVLSLCHYFLLFNILFIRKIGIRRKEKQSST